jgi:RNA polymerase sigma-70 factor (ECF subfamily)
LKSKPAKWEEETLVSGCLKNEATAQKALYEQYCAQMMGVCYRYVQNQFDAEDVLQEGFIKVFMHIGQYKFAGSLEGWIKRIMVTTAINFLKSNKHFQQNLEIERAGHLAVNHYGGESLQHKDILGLIAGLPAGYRTILNLYAIEGYSHKEIGEMLGIAESTSRSQYARAKNTLSTLIDQKNLMPVIKIKEDE